MSIISPDDTAEHPVIGRVRPVGDVAPCVGTRVGAVVDAEITGPMPVLDLADGHVHVTLRRDVTIVAVDGGLDDDLASRIVPSIGRSVLDASAVILDLDQVTLLDRTALEAVCSVLDVTAASTPRCIVAGRLSGRLVLERWGLPASFAVFSSVADALQARAFIESGYGNGWATTV